MVNFLRKLFIKNYNDLSNQRVRDAHGKLASFFGIFSNLLLFLMKFIVGIFASSIAIIGDSFNNLSDMASSAISLFGFYMSSKPADRKHPYGHERFEYISSLLVSLLIVVIGVELMLKSVTSFYNGLFVRPTVNFSIITIIVLIVSIVIKLLQALFNKKMGKIIESITLEATAKDSLNDVITTSSILLATVVSFIWPIIKIGPYYILLDSLMGVIVAIFILISGFKLIIESIDPLIGVSPDYHFVKKVSDDILNYKGVLGLHDIMCHMYGPTKCFMSAHVEVDAKSNINVSHELIDQIERDIKQKYHIELVIHMDPVDYDSEIVKNYREEVRMILNEISPALSFHDFRITSGETHTNIIFDCVVPFEFKLSNDEIKDIVSRKINAKHQNVWIVINFDIDYVDNK